MILDTKINKLVNEICKLHHSNDNEVFFSKIQLLLIDCSSLLDNSIIYEYERLMIKQASKYWLEKADYLNEVLKVLRILIGSKRGLEKNISESRRSALDCVNGFLLTYEDYEPDEQYERTNSFDYCVFYLLNAGIDKEKLIFKMEKFISNNGTD